MSNVIEDFVTLPLNEKVDRFVSDVFGGEHHLRKLENMVNHYVCFPYGTLATYDDDKLTRIVIASHKYGLRAEINNNGMRGIKIYLHNRVTRDGRMFNRHPTISEALTEKG